jgi:hypothetical protein
VKNSETEKYKNAWSMPLPLYEAYIGCRQALADIKGSLSNIDGRNQRGDLSKQEKEVYDRMVASFAGLGQTMQKIEKYIEDANPGSLKDAEEMYLDYVKTNAKLEIE